MNDDASKPAKTSPGHLPHGLASGADLPPGYIVGEYRIDAAVGRGGMGVVYAATQPVIEKRVAIKVLHVQFSSDPALTRRFVDEARAVNRVRHENIIDIFSFGQLPDGRHYFVMEYLEGTTLGAAIEDGTLDLRQVPMLLAQVCDALDAAHGTGIVHRDLKPENIWILTPRHGRQMIKLLDFGIAKLASAGDQNVTQTGVVMGTPHFMSPEQCYGRNVDHRTDIYAMGVLLYRIYAGRFPFDGETFTEIIAKHVTAEPLPPGQFASLPPALDRLIVECLAKDVTQRPQSARDLGVRLASAFTSGGAASASPLAATAAQFHPSSASPASSSSSGSVSSVRVAGHGLPRWLLFAGAGLAVVVAVAAAFFWARSGGKGDQAADQPTRSTTTRAAARPSPMPGELSTPQAATGVAAPEFPDASAASALPSKTEARSGEAKAVGTDSPAGEGVDRANEESLAAKRQAPAVAAPPKAAPAVKPGRSRASDRGLVTDNPFE